MTSEMSQSNQPVLGIRREDKSRWERRVPVAPHHVKELVDQGIKVIVQPSNLRVFSDEEFAKVGAVVDEDLDEAQTIIAVKEVPQELLLPDKTYMFFSHTIKAQPANMGMLDSILEKNIRLIDYEKITDPSNQRLVRFGKFAGYAGMIDMLRIIGERLLVLGFSTPFLNIGYAHMYPSLKDAKAAVKAVGEEIKRVGLPRAITPMVFTFTGATGQVGQGASEIFKLLPFENVDPENLNKMVQKNRAKSSYSSLSDLVHTVSKEDEMNRHTLFATFLNVGDYTVAKDRSQKFDKADYYAHPEKYESVFHEKILPATSVLINCAYWETRFPRIVSNAHMRELVKSKKNRLIGIADLACDISGAVEFNHKATTIDRPVFIADPETGAVHDGFEGKGVLVLSVDNLPTELPREASVYFGDSLLPFLPAIVRNSHALSATRSPDIAPAEGNASNRSDVPSLPAEIEKAVITFDGALTKNFEYIADLRGKYESKLHRILLLGSGFVVSPVVDYLMRSSDNRLTIASMDVSAAEDLAKEFSPHLITAVEMDVQKAEGLALLDQLVQSHKLVISLIPATLHPVVAKLCIAHKKNLVTASYVSPAMRELDEEARQAGVCILNEVGLDPGIDHMASLRMIDEVKRDGGKIISYKSVCGGLPAPEASNNPLGYKFSWFPKGVLLASQNSARFKENNKIVEVSPQNLLKSARLLDIDPCFRLEVLPNRDSLSYMDNYKLHDVETMFRGTLRYKGFSNVMDSLAQLGLFSAEKQTFLEPGQVPISWHRLLVKQVGLEENSLEKAVFTKLNLSRFHKSERGRIMGALEWLGLFDETNIAAQKGTLIDSLCDLLSTKLCYERGERDMVILSHILEIEWPEQTQKEERQMTLIAYGDTQDGGYTAMAKTVGLPVAISSQLLLDGHIKATGVLAPFLPEIYNPIMDELANEGITMLDSSVYL